MKKKATITVETERLLVITQSNRAVTSWCRDCNAEVSMIPIAEAAAVAGLSQRAIFRLVEGGQIHFVETTEGRALFCANSLLGQRDRTAGPATRP